MGVPADPQPHHVLGGTQRPSLWLGWAQHPASQLAARSVKELIRALECSSAQMELKAYAKCQPFGFQGGKSQRPCATVREGERQQDKKKK